MDKVSIPRGRMEIGSELTPSRPNDGEPHEPCIQLTMFPAFQRALVLVNVCFTFPVDIRGAGNLLHQESFVVVMDFDPGSRHCIALVHWTSDYPGGVAQLPIFQFDRGWKLRSV